MSIVSDRGRRDRGGSVGQWVRERHPHPLSTPLNNTKGLTVVLVKVQGIEEIDRVAERERERGRPSEVEGDVE